MPIAKASRPGEPVQVATPPKEINLALSERGKKLYAQEPIDSPTVLNSRLNIAQFRDGRTADLKKQAGGPIANPEEMAFSHQRTHPYFHDRAAETLGEAIDVMGRLPLRRTFAKEKNTLIAA